MFKQTFSNVLFSSKNSYTLTWAVIFTYQPACIHQSITSTESDAVQHNSNKISHVLHIKKSLKLQLKYQKEIFFSTVSFFGEL